jgi:hypothetical protein
MLTPEEIEAQIRADHPEFRVSEGDEVTVISPETDPEAYEQMIDERVVWALEQQERNAELQAKKDIRRIVREGLPVLEANLTTLRGTGTISAAEQRRMVGDVTKAAIEIIKGLESLNLLEE